LDGGSVSEIVLQECNEQAKPLDSYKSSMSTLLLRNGRVIDPAQNIDHKKADLWLKDGRILGLGPQPGASPDRTIDCSGKILSPGLIDMHVHLREPGREEDETIATG